MNTTKAKSKSKSRARFDARLTPLQKETFEKAATIKGYRSLTEFVIRTTQEAATDIIERHNLILASQKDKEIFFNALMSPSKPNKALIQASKSYLKLVSDK